MQPTIHQEEKPNIYRSRFTFQCIVGCIFYPAGLIITREYHIHVVFQVLKKVYSLGSVFFNLRGYITN
jgi:hypothetical protein